MRVSNYHSSQVGLYRPINFWGNYTELDVYTFLQLEINKAKKKIS